MVNSRLNKPSTLELPAVFRGLHSSRGPHLTTRWLSVLLFLLHIRKPDSGFLKLRFWIRVFIPSSGAETISEALAPQTEATKFCDQLALL
jgi:hypothetical protein